MIDYIIYKRISCAQTLLEAGMSATEAALTVGFGDYSSFYRAYKKITGHSPKQSQAAIIQQMEISTKELNISNNKGG